MLLLIVILTKGFLKRNLTGIIWILLYGTIRAFELVSGRQFAQRIARNTMAAGESHWWVGVGSLLPQDRTCKYAVETTVRAKINLDGQFVLRVVPYAGDLALLHNLRIRRNYTTVLYTLPCFIMKYTQYEQ